MRFNRSLTRVRGVFRVLRLSRIISKLSRLNLISRSTPHAFRSISSRRASEVAVAVSLLFVLGISSTTAQTRSGSSSSVISTQSQATEYQDLIDRAIDEVKASREHIKDLNDQIKLLEKQIKLNERAIKLERDNSDNLEKQKSELLIQKEALTKERDLTKDQLKMTQDRVKQLEKERDAAIGKAHFWRNVAIVAGAVAVALGVTR